MGFTLPEPPGSLAAYMPALQWSGIVHVSGQLPLVTGELRHRGRLGDELGLEEGVAAAQRCMLNALAVLRSEIGQLDRIAQIVKLTVFVASAPDFDQQPAVANGASRLLVDALQDRGRHARSAVGVASLPLGAPVEIELSAGVS